MKIIKKSFSVSVKLSKGYNSVGLTEGFEVEINDDKDLTLFNDEKHLLIKKVISETRNALDNKLSENTKIDLNIGK